MSFQISVEFDRSNKTYFPGDLLKLKIILFAKKSFKTRLISTRFLGYCATSWTESDQTIHDTNNQNYTGYEEYFRHYQNVAGEEKGPEIEIPAGESIFSADFRLPLNLPSSYEYSLGFVHYEIKINIDMPWVFNNCLRENFFVVSPLDLNQYPQTKNPVRVENSSRRGLCCCFKADKISLLLSLPHSGFTKNEPVSFIIECDNESSKDVNLIRIRLIQKIKFFIQKPVKDSKFIKFIVTERILPGVKRFQRKIYEETLPVPSGHELINMEFCELIESRYSLQAQIDSSKLKVEHQVLLGSIGYGHNSINLGKGMNRELSLPSYDQAVKKYEVEKLLEEALS